MTTGSPRSTEKKVPLPVLQAQEALSILSQEKPELSKQLSSPLCSYALREHASGNPLNVADLLNIAQNHPEKILRTTPRSQIEKKQGPVTKGGYLRRFSNHIDNPTLNTTSRSQQTYPYNNPERAKAYIEATDMYTKVTGDEIHDEIVKGLIQNSPPKRSTFKNTYQILKNEKHSPLKRSNYKRTWPEQDERIPAQRHLSLAVVYGNLEKVKLAISKGADIAAKDNEAIILAASHGHLEVVRYLHSKGADLQARNNQIAIEAVINMRIPIIDYVEENNVNISFITPGRLAALREWQKGKNLWQKTVRVTPPLHLHTEHPGWFKKSGFDDIKNILAFEKRTWQLHGDKETEITQINRAAFYAAGLFGTALRAMKFFEKWKPPGIRPLYHLLQTIRLPREYNPETRMSDWGDAVIQCGPSMAGLVKFAAHVTAPARGSGDHSWSAVNTRTLCASIGFKNATMNPALAELCLAYDADNDDFEAALNILQKGPPPIKTIPEILIDGEAYGLPGTRFRRLEKDDIRALFLGAMTGCCQWIGHKDGIQCVQHGYKSPEGGFYVVETNDNKIIAQTWAWRGQDGELCFDSIETLGNRVSPEQWTKILQQTAKILLNGDGHDVTALHVGTGGRTPYETLQQTFPLQATAIPRDYHIGYRDSEGPQILICSKPNPT